MPPDSVCSAQSLPAVSRSSLEEPTQLVGRDCCGYVELILDSVPHVVWTASADGANTSLNRRGMAYTGLCPRLTATVAGWPRLTPMIGNWLEGLGRSGCQRGRTTHVECRFHRFDGVYRWHSLPGRAGARLATATWPSGSERQPTSTTNGNWSSLCASRRRRRCRHSALLETIGDAAPVGFKLVDRDLRIVRINKRLAEVDGRTVPEASDAPSPKRFRICGPSSKTCTVGHSLASPCPTSC